MLSFTGARLQEKARGQATFLHHSAVLSVETCWALPLHTLPSPCWLCACRVGVCLVGLLFSLAGAGTCGFLCPPDSPLHQLLGFCWWSVTLRMFSPQKCRSPVLMNCTFVNPSVKTEGPQETCFYLSVKSLICNYFLAWGLHH